MATDETSASGLAARRVAWAVLRDVICEGRLLSEALQTHNKHLARLEAADRALAEHLARTTLRHRGQLQHILARFLRKPLRGHKACPALALLLMGMAQLLVMRTPAHAAISTSVELLKRDARLRHFAGLANAVLRRTAENGEALLQATDALRNIPNWLRQRLHEAYGERAVRGMAVELLREPPLDITVKHAAEAATWAGRLHGKLLPTGSLRIERPKGPVPSLPGYDEGAWWVQDAAAALPARLLGNAAQDMAGLRVADLCAAPGGKTAQLAAAGAQVLAVDISTRRLRRLRENLHRLGLAAEIIEADATTWKPEKPLDAVLLDAPCTATGTFRRHPDVLFAKSEAQAAELADLQRHLLAHAATLLKPGGVLVYCVCSLLPEEGEMQIAHFLESEPGHAFTREAIMAEEVAGQSHFITPAGDVRTLPHMNIGEEQGLDGFYIARLRKQA